jgi:DNA-binding response OmpR family regulator
MGKAGKILIVDDEQQMLDLTGKILSQGGYTCDLCIDVDCAIELIHSNEYDLLISDIAMPGNENLEFIQEVKNCDKNLPIILMTGYPTVESAIESVQLPVVAYLVKPVNYPEMLNKVEHAIKISKINNTIRNSRKNLEHWRKELMDIETVLQESAETGSFVSINDFIDLTFRNVDISLSGVKSLVQVSSMNSSIPEVCHLLECPKLENFSNAIRETIEILEKTKSSFKSKELGICVVN